MILSLVLIIVGFALLIKGADWLVTGASALAKKNNISDLVIGLTIVSFGTSAPELVVNSIASFTNHPDIVFGNIIGSNNVNMFLVLGIVGIILPIKVQSSTVWKEIPISIFAAIMVFLLANSFIWQNDLILGRFEALVLLIFFAGFLYYVFLQMKKETPLVVTDPAVKVTKNLSNTKIWGLMIIGLAGLVGGGKLVVDNATIIATTLGVSEKIIGLTIVAIGTSLPELVTSIVAAIKKNSDIVIGNVIGSNIFNLLFILPISALVDPVQYNPNFNIDLYLLIGGTAILFIAMFTGKARKIDRWEAMILLLVYGLYTAYLILQEI